jgi:SAM-dependent methyltransferase
MLDVACGRGRHARMLAAKGFDVTGFDLSPGSIDFAMQFENDRLHFYEHDVRMPFWINYFDYAFNFFTSFGYFRTEREHHNAIRTVSQALKVNGTFVIDYLNAQYAEEHLVPESEKEIDGVHYHLIKKCDETHFYKKIIIEDKVLKEPLEFTEKVGKFNLADFNRMLESNGLQVQHVFGDYLLNEYNKRTSPRLLIIAMKLK